MKILKKKKIPTGADCGEEEINRCVEFLRRVREAVLAAGKSAGQEQLALPRYRAVREDAHQKPWVQFAKGRAAGTRQRR